MRGNRLNKFLDQFIGLPLLLILAAVLRLKGSGGRRPPSPKRILIVKLAALGDTLLLQPAIRSIKEQYPAANITLLATDVNADVARLFPSLVNEIMILEVKRVVRNPLQLLRFVGRVRSRRFEVAFDFEQWAFITPILLSLSGIPWRIGFQSHSRTRHLLYDEAVKRQVSEHEAMNFVHLASGSIEEPFFPPFEISSSEEHLQSVRSVLSNRGWRDGKPLIVIHPGCGSHGFPREWPLASYKELVTRLAAEKDSFFVFTGMGVERKLAQSLAAHAGSRGILWDGTTLPEMVALLTRADLFISSNNGIMHLAAALNRPQIALHGPTDWRKWGPLNRSAVVINSSCRGCPCLDFGYEYHRVDGFCMAQISVDEVYQAAEKTLTKSSS